MVVAFWGKARPRPGDSATFHALEFHALDVAAVAEILLDLYPAPIRGFIELSAAPIEDVRRLLVRLAALHDIGKYARGFQGKVPERWPPSLGPLPSPLPLGDHTAIGLHLLCGRDLLRTDMRGLIADYEIPRWTPLIMATVAHHGRPVLGGPKPRRTEIGEESIAAAKRWIATIRELVPGPAFTGILDEAAAARLSLPLAGLVNLADWIGSNQSIFEYHEEGDPADYWSNVARPAARRAVERSGIRPSTPSPRAGFAALTGLAMPASPLQHWAETVSLPDRGPVLAIVEDVTGAGKTEAALILAHRLMLAGLGDGFYVALPTQATADAMYRRLRTTHRRLFADDSHPSLVLAHGASKLDDLFRRSIVAVGEDEAPYGSRDDEETASAACAAWIADDRRKAFFADVGAGTIDQAFLAVLPSKFAALRLLGLSRRVLIIDEAHCYGAYESEELMRLIAFQAAAGGATIILSATLADPIKDRLVHAFRQGLGRTGDTRRLDWPRAYPSAALVVSDAAPRTDAVATRPDRCRSVAVERLPDAAAAVEAIVAAAQRGAAVAWIRNTVDDVLDGEELLRACGLEPIVFHARFAMIDRQRIEARVTKCFGRASCSEYRRGRVVVASQVIEQSLDLDFDVMVSDLAPVDLLIQRAGRLWRHAGRERAVAEPRLLVVSPPAAPEAGRDWYRAVFPRAAHVYRNHALLWRSADILFRTGAIVSPEGVRALVAAVYGVGALDDVPKGLERSWIAADGEDRAAASLAESNLLRPEDGYVATSAWSPDVLVPTRLGDERRIFRLARWDGERLTPWAPIVDPTDRFEEARAWALSEVSLRASRADGRGGYPREIEQAAVAIEERWRKHGDGRSVVLPIVISPDGTGSGTLVDGKNQILRVIYHRSRGMVFPVERD